MLYAVVVSRLSGVSHTQPACTVRCRATGFGGRCRAIGCACRWSIRIAGIDHIRGTRVRAQTVGSCIVTWELAMSWPEVDLVLDVRVRALGDQARDQARTVGCICVYIETRI